MLVFNRRKNESIMIGDNVKITIVSVMGDKVKIGIEAPRDLSVHRDEIYAQIKGSKSNTKNVSSVCKSPPC